MTHASSPAIACHGLAKSYGAFRALDGLDLEVARGEVFGFLGPNGAGKTTTIRLLMGMLVPSAGAARLLGVDCHRERVAAKHVVGYLPDDPVFPEHLRGRELLEFAAAMHGLPRPEARRRAEELLLELGLDDAAHDFANTYSMGMRRKLALACARVHEPPLFILDEPTNGLDPHAQREVVSWIAAASAAGRTVFLSTHLLDLAERICTRVGIISQGRLLAVGTTGELKDRLCPGGSLEEVFFAVARADD
ncbi:MAG: ABC transporter ATP-binding protein [Vicinamibacteria bacterium]|nr:ABC transporter ATP-binding protein [Vicinamibacteria bacterium]